MKASQIGSGSMSETASGPPVAVQLVRAALLVLGLAEIRQHVGMAPADIAELAPAVEVLAPARECTSAR